MKEDKDEIKKSSKEWWKSKRVKYNKGLVIAGILAFFAYAMVGEIFILPYDNNYEITLFTIAFQGLGYLFMMGIANILYSLGYVIDIRYNKKNEDSYRERLFNLGYWFSVCLPFIIPVLLFIEYLIYYLPKK